MNRYFATFVAGTKEIVTEILRREYKDISFEEIFDNLLVFKTDKQITPFTSIPYLNNVFLVINKFGSPEMQDFTKLTEWCLSKNTFINQFYTYADKYNFHQYKIQFFEDRISVSRQDDLSKLKVAIDLKHSSGFSDFEVWFLKRTEGVSFVGIRLTKKPDYQELLPKGELRHELSYILGYLSELKSTDTVLDPFSGHGSIPLTICKHFKVLKVIASDKEIGNIKTAMSNERVKYSNLSIERLDGYSLESIKDESIDKIVTDPPWGASTEVDNLKIKYEQMLNSFHRVIKHNGILILLTSQGELVDSLLKKVNFKLFHKYQVNVGGRGSYVYKLRK